MFIANHYTNIKDTEENPMTIELLEQLDKMLTDNNIQHFFAEPHTKDLEKEPDTYESVYYEDADEIAFFLVYALWCKQYRGLSDERIKKAMIKEATK